MSCARVNLRLLFYAAPPSTVQTNELTDNVDYSLHLPQIKHYTPLHVYRATYTLHLQELVGYGNLSHEAPGSHFLCWCLCYQVSRALVMLVTFTHRT